MDGVGVGVGVDALDGADEYDPSAVGAATESTSDAGAAAVGEAAGQADEAASEAASSGDERRREQRLSSNYGFRGYFVDRDDHVVSRTGSEYQVFGPTALTYSKLLRRVNLSSKTISLLPEMGKVEDFNLGRVSQQVFQSIEDNHPHDKFGYPLEVDPDEELNARIAEEEAKLFSPGSPAFGQMPEGFGSGSPTSPTSPSGLHSPVRPGVDAAVLLPRDQVAKYMTKEPRKFKPRVPPREKVEAHMSMSDPPIHNPPGLAPQPGPVPSSRGAEPFYNYCGTWKAGQMSGHGYYIFADGGTYDGSFVSNLPHGRGVATYPDGTVYDGAWVHGRKQGKGLCRHASGSVYEGDFFQDKRHGVGKLTFKSGQTYEGQWHEGRKWGRGKLVSSRGHVYDGSWRNGLIEGSGTLVLPNFERFVRRWEPCTMREAVERVIKERSEKLRKAREEQWELERGVREIELAQYVEDVREYNIELEEEKKRMEEAERIRLRDERREKVRKARMEAMEAAAAL